ncbi:mortality factor 4-like protein 1 isoform X1 [Leptopilina heterotoma]|uniref:mortality factor 4-like protein 1 isoform X1 n=1 Tax=Leptopilina heterotoma TaxID=63436 RepID=UPI001CA8ACB4|nr:mortality factor 4-like protein 1 isoform X1 [Leptopilina heterotoma]
MPPKHKFQEGTSRRLFNTGEKVLCFHGPLIYEAKCLKSQVAKEKQVKYLIHYAGWNKNWDEWVPESRVLKYNEANCQKQREVQRAHSNQQSSQKSRKSATGTKTQGRRSEGGREKDSDSRASTPVANVEKATSRSGKYSTGSLSITSHDSISEAPRKRRGRLETSGESEEFFTKVELKILIPHDLKVLLVEESETLSKGKKLPILPMRITVEKILNDYVAYQEKDNVNDSCRESALEVTKGIREYFNISLGQQLLYKWEKLQFEDITRENPDALPSQLYGAFHLLRLFVKLGSMLSYIEMDERSVQFLTLRFHDFLQFMQKNKDSLFNLQQDYRDSTLEYQRKNSQS